MDRQISANIAMTAAFLVLVCSVPVHAQGGRISRSLQKNMSTPGPVQAPLAAATPLIESQFLARLDQAIEITSKRTLTANSHSPWQIFHGILALRNDCQLRLGNDKVKAIEWLSTAEPQYNKQPWMLLTAHGAKFHPYNNVMYHFEGHPGQFLALLSESNLPLDHQMKVQGKTITLNDVVNNTMKEVNTQEEVTWVLWALQHYLKPDAVWTNQKNETWSIERLVKMETDAAVVHAPCGGNHRLFALTRARDKYLETNDRLRGVWFEANQKINQHIEIARSLQNVDGSFSSDWYAGQKYTNEINLRLNTTGHTTEFLAISLPKERLNETWVKNAVWRLSEELISHRNSNEIGAGPLFHTLDALILYRNRIRANSPSKESEPAKTAPQIASSISATPTSTASKPAPIRIPGPKTEESPTFADEKSWSADEKPPVDGQSVPEAKIASKVPADRSQANLIPFTLKNLVAGPQATTAESRRATMSQSTLDLTRRGTLSDSRPTVDPSQLSDVGEPAPISKPGRDQRLSPRASNGGRLSGTAPALLTDTGIKPLLTTEVPADECGGSSLPELSNSKNSIWIPTAPERSGQLTQSEESNKSSSQKSDRKQETASALEPCNI